MAVDLKDLKGKTDMELASMINGLEGFMWKLNHDAADGRIEHDVDPDIKKMRKTVEQIVAEIKTRTGIADNKELGEYIRSQVKNQEKLWGETWAEIYKEGTVFRALPGTRRYSKDQPSWETIRTYLPPRGMSGPNQFVIARMHEKEGIIWFDDREVTGLEIIDTESRFTKGDFWTRELIKADEAMEQRAKYISEEDDIDWIKWRKLRDSKEFTHAGFDSVFETLGFYNLPDTDRHEGNEVVLTRTKLRKMHIEFTPKDMPGIVITESKFEKYVHPF